MPIPTVSVEEAAAEGWSYFVDSILNDLTGEHGIAIDDSVRAFILEHAIEGEDVWQMGLQSGQLEVERVHGALTDAMNFALLEDGADAWASYSPRLDQQFRYVIEARWHCPFPLLFC